MLENIIQYRFRQGEGAREVKAGNYELVKTKNSSQPLSKDVRLLPGTEITMAVIVRKRTSDDETCPMTRCGSTETTPIMGGGRVW
jgi:hypothetical protein